MDQNVIFNIGYIPDAIRKVFDPSDRRRSDRQHRTHVPSEVEHHLDVSCNKMRPNKDTFEPSCQGVQWRFAGSAGRFSRFGDPTRRGRCILCRGNSYWHTIHFLVRHKRCLPIARTTRTHTSKRLTKTLKYSLSMSIPRCTTSSGPQIISLSPALFSTLPEMWEVEFTTLFAEETGHPSHEDVLRRFSFSTW